MSTMHKTRTHQRARVGLVVLLAVALTLAACGDDAAESSGSTTTTPDDDSTTTIEPATTTTEAEPLDEKAAVLKAYREAWAAYPSYINGTADEPLEAHFAGDRLENIPGVITGFAERETRLEGAPVLAPGSRVLIDGDVATFNDCLLDRTSNVVKSTGEVTDLPDELPQKVAVTMAKVEGEWKLATVIFDGLGSCTQ